MEDKIDNCVSSILAQTYKNIEVILVDDGSKDKSLLHCQRLSEKDNRVKVYHTENRGSGPARNYGLSKASGEYVYFPDADDNLDPAAIEILVNATVSDNVDLVVFGFEMLIQAETLFLKRSMIMAYLMRKIYV